jgi:hypothetical protein
MDIDVFFIHQHLENIQDAEMDEELTPVTAMASVTLAPGSN